MSDLIKQISNEQLVEMFYVVKNARSDLAKQDKELKAKQERIEMELGNRCIEMGVDSYKAGGASVTRYVQRTIIVQNQQDFLKWAQENGRMDLVKIDRNSSPMKEYASQNEGELPEGVGYLDKYLVSITKS